MTTALKRVRYGRCEGAAGHRNGHRDRHVLGMFGSVTVSVPRARVTRADGTSAEWRSHGLPAYQRLTQWPEARSMGTDLAGTNTRRVRRVLGTLFEGAGSPDTVRTGG